MTSDLRDRLDDLLAEVPSSVVPDPGTAWRVGARRRTRRRALVAGSALGVLALLAGAVTWGTRLTDAPPAHDGGSGVNSQSAQSYPVRIEDPLLRTGTLSDDGGAVAGVVQRPDGWYAIGQHGQVWRIPLATDTSYLPAVSPDGTRLAYLGSSTSSLSAVDLTTGGVHTVDVGAPGVGNAWVVRPHTQMFWSPDSGAVAVEARQGLQKAPRVDAVVVPFGRPQHAVRGPHEPGHLLLAGWYDDHTLVWVSWTLEPQGRSTVGAATALLTDLDGRVTRTVPLRIQGHWTDPLTSTSVSVSPDGHLLSLGTDQGPELSVWWYYLDGPQQEGTLKAELPPSPYGSTAGCPASWNGSVALPAVGYPDTILSGPGGASIVYADPRLDLGCSLWASHALSGTAYRDLTARVFDDSGRVQLGTTSWLSWHWRETVILGAFGVALLVGVVAWRRRRRVGRLPGSGTPG